MAKETNRRIEANLRNPEFRKLLEKANLMIQQGKKESAAYHILKHMNLERDKNNPDLFLHIPDRQLAEMLGLPKPGGGGKTVVSNARQRLKQERWGIEKVVKNVEMSKVQTIGSGDQSVYLYYFPTYREHAIFYMEKNVDDSYTTPIYRCNIGKTIGDVKDRVRDQIGQQLPEKPKIALIIRTEDCQALEKEIHARLKRDDRWLDPNSGADVVGVEWFLTNPAEVEGIVESIEEERKKEKAEELEKAKQLLNVLGINDPNESQLDTVLEMLHSTNGKI